MNKCAIARKRWAVLRQNSPGDRRDIESDRGCDRDHVDQLQGAILDMTQAIDDLKKTWTKAKKWKVMMLAMTVVILATDAVARCMYV
eukprot:CAMPEP_0171309576 /NCGR_PEP_ID=MMETSP0816-20121228/19756_1 /TAXON_ID=420281 /ORGANISM="Proboscia inermis, Strain CCAP1064/1" /LENGTH=86 /DNA_ID=CAMNT_0011793221 /DNA_START=309 /DNA_END=570 /DNA_ORIENTATION=+